ncbi:regulator of microtubule dynamics protein 3-like isoform X2 [Hypanus sabinus]|uniref:regulator of microtubule dynamics protein 3-like isoform X2 n=1 Tax=Hypanus sabinus TaxID=79690 RepID=UPI0028C406A4|nr:regulator of microtubule dynamics protein 3-like isoform X2 [Hypanus sabinus]
MFSKQSFRPLGLLAGVGVASGALGIYYLWRQQRGSILLEALEEVEGAGAVAQPEQQKQAPTLAGAQEPPSGVLEEQAEIRWHLDSIQTCLDGLKEEVTSLKQCIQGFVGKQVSVKKYKSARRKKRRYEAKRDSDDSADSLSVYFTANAEKSSDSETEAGQTEIPAGSDCSMLAFATAALTEDRVALDADPSSLQLQESIGHAMATNEAEMEKDEEEVNDLVQVLNFSPPLEHEANSVQCPQPAEGDKNEITFLLHEIDRLHDGTKEEQEQGFKVLLDYKNKYGKRKEFCWRMIRAYSDMFQLTEDKETQNCYALAGRDEGMASLKEHEDSIECQIWLAIVSGYVEDQEADDRSEGNEELKEIEDEVGVLDEPSNSSDIMKSAPGIVHLDDMPEITDKQHPVLQDMQPQRESNVLFEVFNSFDTVYSQLGTSSVTGSTELTEIEDRNKEQDKKALDEANMMVEFIDGYHIMFRNECLLDAPDGVKTLAMDSDNDQDETDEVRDV